MEHILEHYFKDYSYQDNLNLYTQIGIFVIITISAFVQLYVKVEYGKLTSQNSQFLLSSRFSWIIQEIPNLVVSGYFVYEYISKSEMNIVNIVVISCFILHYIHRTLIFPFFIENTYSFTILPVVSAFVFTSINSFLQCRSVLLFSEYSENYLTNIDFIVGLSVFILGMIINIYHDYSMILQRKSHLSKIKEKDKKQDNQDDNLSKISLNTNKTNIPDKYILPHGGLFEFIDCPNYFGEFIEWLGFGIMSRTISGYLFAYTTFAVLFTRALSYHDWYKNKFKEKYPLNRKAFIPYII